MRSIAEHLQSQKDALVRCPELIEVAWQNGFSTDENKPKLFGYMSRRGDSSAPEHFAGCLTQIRQEDNAGAVYFETIFDKKIERIIKKDKRIPKNREDIRVEHLDVFVAYQTIVGEWRQSKKGFFQSVRMMHRILKLNKMTWLDLIFT